MAKTAVIVREKDYELYVSDIPMYRGMESWTGIREEAYHFGDEEEASECMEAMSESTDNLLYIHIEVENGEEVINLIQEKHNLQIDVNYVPFSSRLFFMKDKTKLEALNYVFAEARDRSDLIKTIRIRDK